MSRIQTSRSQESRVNRQESTSIVSQAATVAPSLSTRSFTPTPPSANANERTSLSQSHALIDSHNLLINGGHFNHTHGHHTNLVIHINQGSPPDSRSSSPPLNEIRNISLAQISDQSSQVDHEKNQSKVSSQSQKTSFQKSNDIYERHLTLKGRGFPLWIPDPNQVLHLDYRRTGVRIGDVGIITHSGAFSFLFNICLPHDDPVNPRMLPEHFAPIWPPIEATDIEKFIVFKNGSHLVSASVKKKSQTGSAISDIVFESSASEGAILTMPRGARSEDLGNLARFREYAAANVANWYRFVNGPRGREAKNGDVRLVVGFDKATSWGIATFANETQQNGCLLKFGPSEGDSANTYTWSEYSGVADVRAGPDSDEIDELRIDSDPPDVKFENQCLFVRTLNVTLADDVWANIHSSSGSQYPRVKNYSDSNRPHSNNPDNGSNFSTSQGAPSGTQRRLPVKTSDEDPPIFVSGPVESTAHPSKVLNDDLLAKIPTAKMVITHDDDWSSVSQNDPHALVANILTSRDIYQENDVVFLQPKSEFSEGSTCVNRDQVPEAAVVQDSAAHYIPPLTHDKPIQESFHSDRGVNERTAQDDEQSAMKQRLPQYPDAPLSTTTNVPSTSVSCPLPVPPAQGTSYVDVKNRPPSIQFTDRNSPPGMALKAEDIKNATKLLGSDIIIAFMGPTGSGKSNIIDTLTNQPGRRSGSRLELCTTEVRAVRLFNHPVYGDRLVLVDTPGFDDTNKSDLEILQIIASWLQKVYEKDIKLAGIIYLHRITDNRMGGSPYRNLRMFGDICGDQAVKKVVLVTTMWDKGNLKTHNQRERDLFDSYWKMMINYGASTARFLNSADSAWKIIDPILKQRGAEALLLQEELVDLKRPLNETQAGMTLHSDLQRLLAELRDTIRSLAEQAREQSNPQLARKLEAELKRIQRDFDKTFNEIKRLEIPFGKRLLLLVSKKSRGRPMNFGL